ncbi:MAG: LysR substrate-binding domain-containing protein [Sphingobium sp.]
MRQLEILAEVARVGTFRGAARHLGLSQVAVSDHIKQLENRLGCALFVRNVGGKPTLSPSGKVVLDHGRNVLFACDALISAARGVDNGVAEEPPEPLAYAPDIAVAMELPVARVAPEKVLGNDTQEVAAEPEPLIRQISLAQLVPDEEPVLPAELERIVDTAPPAEPLGESFVSDAPNDDAIETNTIAASVNEKPITVASHPAILSRFQDRLAAAQEAFPDRPIAVDFARFTPDVVGYALRNGRADIALFYALGEVPGLPSEYLWSERWSLFARHDHPLAQMEAVEFQDCQDMPVILFDEANPIRPLAEACLKQSGLWPTPTVLETDDYTAIAAELDYGEAIFPAFGVTAQQFAARPGLKRLALIQPLPSVEVRRAIAASAQDDPTISALAGLLG